MTAPSKVLSKLGWGVWLAICTLLVLNGVISFTVRTSPSTFEQNTGVSIGEVRRAYPTVVDELVGIGQDASISLGGMGLIALLVAWEGYRHGARWTWRTLWALSAVLLILGLKSALVDGRPEVAGLYLILATATLLAQILARIGDHAALSNTIWIASILFYVTRSLGVLFFLPTAVANVLLGGAGVGTDRA